MILAEGGNVFKDAAGQILTQRINQADVMPTIKWIEQVTDLDFTKDLSALDNLPVKWLGSTGRKDTSGDLDLSVDTNQLTKEQLVAKLTQWAQKNNIDPNQSIKKSGIAVHFLTPIAGNAQNGYVQTDFMFANKPQWNQFVLSNDPASQYKGALRNIMINSIAKSMEYKLNQNDGIMDRASNNFITDDPDKVAKMLLNPNASAKDLYSVEKILAQLKMDPKREEKIADFQAHLAREGITDVNLDETVELESEVSFIARLRDRIINQGLQPLVESVRIEHPEDMIFDQGSQGISRALDGLAATVKNPNSATVKWDGRPAIIFGRDPQGRFVLTDKSGFTASGYNGLATSPEQIAKMMARRGGERGELIAIYQRLFPLLRRTVPQDFRGYVQGDLLYASQPPVDNGAFVFKPNTVTYRVPTDSALGQKIAQSEVAVAIHTGLSAPGAQGQPIRAATLTPAPGVLILDPSLKEPRNLKLNDRVFQDAQAIAQRYGKAIDMLFNPQELRARKITNMPQLMKQYINSRVRSGSYNDLLGGFGPWIAQKEPTKAPRIVEWGQANKQAVAAVFKAFLEISSLKNDLVRQLDAQAHDVQASVNNEPGHEGYVANGMKFVDRMRFSQANFAQNNPDLA